MPPPVLAAIDINALFAVILGGSAMSGIALLVRAVGRGGQSGVKSLEEVVVLHERIIKRQQADLERIIKRQKTALDEVQEDHDRTLEERRLLERERDHLAMLVRYYRNRHGDPTDPRMARLVIDEQGNLKAP